MPIAAWALLITISIFCNLLVGYVAHGQRTFRLLVLPVALSVSLFLIADIDSPLVGSLRCDQKTWRVSLNPYTPSRAQGQSAEVLRFGALPKNSSFGLNRV